MELEDIEFEEVIDSEQHSNTTTPLIPDKAAFATEGIDTQGLTDESISEELIREMKMLGIPKPEGVSLARWNVIMHDSLIHNHMIQMRAAGSNYTKIAETLGYSPQQVASILKTPKVKAKVDEVIKDMYGEDYKKAMQLRASKALAVYDEILDDPQMNPKLKLQAAQQVMEHTIGKPQQTVEHKGGALTDIMQAADQLREAREVGTPLTEKEVELDNMIKEIIPEGLVVGKRAIIEKK